jgi:hypothetical protein
MKTGAVLKRANQQPTGSYRSGTSTVYTYGPTGTLRGAVKSSDGHMVKPVLPKGPSLQTVMQGARPGQQKNGQPIFAPTASTAKTPATFPNFAQTANRG